PASFGREGYLQPNNVTYRRLGLHNAFLSTARTDAVESLLERCRKGTYRPTHYTIFQISPNLLVVVSRIDFSFFYGVILVYDAVRHDRTKLRAWVYPAPFPVARQWLRKLTDPLRAPLVRRLADRIFREDNLVCERLQQAARHMQGMPRLGALEKRI